MASDKPTLPASYTDALKVELAGLEGRKDDTGVRRAEEVRKAISGAGKIATR